MNVSYPITIYFDASCELCRSEMEVIKLNDKGGLLSLVDCSAPEFDDVLFINEGITRVAMMNCLHAQDAQGRWFKGVAAFEVIYHSVGMAAIANLWGHRYFRPLAERIYPWVVRHRYCLSALGFHRVFKLWSKRVARKANQRSQACRDGSCTLPK